MPEFMKSVHLLLVLWLPLSAVEAHENVFLSNGKELISEFQPDEYKTYKYVSTNNSLATVMVTACSGPIEWNVFQSAIDINSTSILLHSSITNEYENYQFPHKKSETIEYTIKLKMNVRGYGSIVTTNISRHKGHKNQTLQMKWKSESDLILRWHKTKKSGLELERNYCVVITTGRHQTNLCSSLTQDEYNHVRNTTRKQHVASFIENYLSSKDQLVYCTNTNLLKLNVDQLFHQSLNESKTAQHISAVLFAIDKTTNVPQQIGSNETYSLRPTVVLKENKMATIKLANGPVTLSLKVLQKSFTNSILDVYVVPCDMRLPFDVDISFSGNQLAARKDLFGFGKLSVPTVQLKKSYVITVSPRSPTTASMLKGVQVFATTLSSVFNPFPEMPRLPAVKEYRTLRTCHSVTVGWIPPNDLRTATYCMVVKQGKVDKRAFQGNQCNLNGQLRRGRVTRNDVAKMCKLLKHTARISVLTQKIDKLKPGKFYNVQIMVRKPKGRMLSYETLQVRTKSKC